MRIAQQLIDEMVAHAREETPNECCGLVAARDGELVSVHRMTNIHHSPLRFEFDGIEQARIYDELDDDGLREAAIYHSHTRSEPRPSQTDINNGRWWPVPWIIVGLNGADPEVRAFEIRSDGYQELELEIG